jgi:hypothetical protein
MNIFILDQNPVTAARFHADKHVNKMILESAQMLSTVLGGRYKPTHANHPCTLWVSRSRANASWLIDLTYALNQEAQARYGHDRDHKSLTVLDELVYLQAVDDLPDIGITPFAQAMPDEYKDPDPVMAYRRYYRSKPFVSWAKGTTPSWW